MSAGSRQDVILAGLPKFNLVPALASVACTHHFLISTKQQPKGQMLGTHLSQRSRVRHLLSSGTG